MLKLSEAPRGGAGIEIFVDWAARHGYLKPLVEGLVLKYIHAGKRQCGAGKPLVEGLVLKYEQQPDFVLRKEAPRGGAGIEMDCGRAAAGRVRKPLVEGLVLKSD